MYVESHVSSWVTKQYQIPRIYSPIFVHLKTILKRLGYSLESQNGHHRPVFKHTSQPRQKSIWFWEKTGQFLRNKSGFQTFNGLMECVPWTKDTAEMGPQSQVGQTAWVYFPKEVAEFPINHKRCQFDSYNYHKLTLVRHFWLIYCHLVTILSELICNICYHNLTIHFAMVACVCMPIDLPLCQNTLNFIKQK